MGPHRELMHVALARHDELLREAIAAHPGGIGKTRLAVETGLRLRDEFDHGVWLVELAALGEPSAFPGSDPNRRPPMPGVDDGRQPTAWSAPRRFRAERELIRIVAGGERRA